MPKVLIITYYWPPSGGSGVQRWLKFAKYLPQFGWEPIIYTPENPDFALKDKTLLKDVSAKTTVLRTRIWEPYQLYNRLSGNKQEKTNEIYAPKRKGSNLLQKIAMTIRGNLLIPDPRCFWIKPSIKFLVNYLNDNPVDAIISTGPPHSMHLIGLGLHKKTSIPWIADFRDPWTNIDFYKDLHLTWLADKIHRHKEQQIISEANCVVSVTPSWCGEFAAKHPKKIALVHNGYDEADVAETVGSLDSEFTLVHIGSINAARNPKVLWQALSELLPNYPELREKLKIKFVGNIEEVVIEDIDKYDLNDYVEKIGYLSHQEAIAFQQKAQLLLLLINNTPNANGILTGKLYEYMASNRPTLAIGPIGSDIAKLLNETGAGTIVGFEDVEGMKAALLSFFEYYQNGKLNSSASGYEQYSRRAQCGVLTEILTEITRNNK
jgi:glycosyltransferase involved in cell wall biosynthesis